MLDVRCRSMGDGGPRRSRATRARACQPGRAASALIEIRREGVRLVTPDDFVVPTAAALEPGHGWFLTALQRGNRATRMRTWTDGSVVRPLVHGRPYFAALGDAAERMGSGDPVLIAGWRADADELVRDDGTTIVRLLARAVRRGVRVAGLVWRSQLDRMQCARRQNRQFSRMVNAVGSEVLLDHRVRPFGSHHQKFVVLRHADRPENNVAFLGGIDVAHSRRDDIDHHGDPQHVRYQLGVRSCSRRRVGRPGAGVNDRGPGSRVRGAVDHDALGILDRADPSGAAWQLAAPRPDPPTFRHDLASVWWPA